MDEGTLREKVAQYPSWYHRIDLGNGVVTPGEQPLKPEWYRLPKSMEGLRVLDIGAWDGYWTFECLKAGAKEVIAIDDFSDSIDHVNGRRKNWDTFDLCADVLGFRSRCERFQDTIWDLDPVKYGTFDYVLMLGVLYHCRHPLLALDIVSAVCTGTLHVESAVCDYYSPYRGGLHNGYAGPQMVMAIRVPAAMIHSVWRWRNG